MSDVDYYDVQRMVEDEARDRRVGDNDLRELVDLRNRELLEAIRELRQQIDSLDRVLNARTEHFV
jgi:hypothetical protein